MTPDRAILAILETVPSRRVRGKKRLQKLSYLWQASGVPIEANFKIKYYGPFSSEIEDACALLSLFGDIEEKEVTAGYADYLSTEYSLPTEHVVVALPVDEEQKKILVNLDGFNTVDLEVASTVLFFVKSHMSLDDAIKKTKEIKPTKVNLKTIESSRKIIAELSQG